MCIVSMVFDQYQPKFPNNPPSPVFTPAKELEPFDWEKFFGSVKLKELENLIKEFKEAVEMAKKLDIVLKQPDCEDPEKAKLLERVKELEAQIKKFKTKKVSKKKK